ncbi:serine/threonine-protein kinase MRCK alpha isoform X1 [Ixodes scapularis]|uniref:serine/threonine-protein kinase MRCK alpha isoform X1 n=1 Tax=Ixodes scapularis TaxID=6945 RepID=UPI0011617A37|nr:serine/threonine-protein kinase MRCK alpha isoform X1 [Ixodes scapularis]
MSKKGDCRCPEERIRELEQMFLGGPVLASGKAFTVEGLIDVLVVLYDECCNSSLRKEKTMTNFIEYVKPVVQRIKDLRLTKDDFDVLKVIGRGAFGEVAVVRERNTGQVYAMKILNKWEMLKRAETACFQEERDVLVFGDRRWITNLHYSFQDETNLYLVMDYYCGGDLLTLLSKFEDKLPEEMSRFYITEMILAVDSIHSLHYVHRDIKPDNVLLDANGHIRLADFGSCLRLCDDGTVQSNVAVGTPDYISPEILRAMEDGQGRYGPECDWWSLGVCMYEMLYGETPFYAESLVETYGKIMNHKNCFDFPDDPGCSVSEDAKDLMRRLICSADCRLGQNGLEDFKRHPWFKGVDWDHVRQSQAPYIPEVSSPTDTSNFDVDEADLKQPESGPPSANAVFSGLHLPFVGFTYTLGSRLAQGEETAVDDSHVVCRRKIQALEREKQDMCQRMARDLKRGLPNSGGGGDVVLRNSSTTDGEVRKLQDEVNTFRKKNAELQLELEQHQPLSNSHGGHSVGVGDVKVKELEKALRLARAEKDDIHRDLTEAQEKLKQQTKELKDALAQRKLAMDEYTEVSDKLSDLRTQKQKLSRQVRDKEEELEKAMHKIDSLRQDLRKADKLRRELEARAEETQAEALKERRLRERSDEYVHHLEGEVEALRQCQLGRLSTQGTDVSQEAARLKSELENQEVKFRELEIQLQTRHATELNSVRDQLREADSARDTLFKEVMMLKEKNEKYRAESAMESQETLAEIKKAHEREKAMLSEEVRKLTREGEQLAETVRRLHEERRCFEEEMGQLREKKESVAQWEAQISEIIQWVSDEKDARGYLQALATKMTEELDYLRMSGLPTPTAEKNWRNRRSQKLEKMELLTLQSSLQSEIQAKQVVCEELSRVRAELVAQQKEHRKIQQEFEHFRKESTKKDSQIRDLQQRLEATGDGFLERPSSQMSFLDQFLKDTSRLNHSESGESAGEAVANDTTESEMENQVPPPPIVRSSTSTEERRGIKISSPISDARPTITVLTPKPKAHQFLVRTFVAPLKCNHCTSLMVGLIRQGAVCEVCGFACHVTCQDKVPAVCPVPMDQSEQTFFQTAASKRPVGIDPTRGVGTAYEGYVKVPKLGGVKKGWQRQFVAVCDFKLFLYDLLQEKNVQPAVSASQVLDMRDEEFSVTSVLESDVIHANRKDIPCIFRVSTSMMDPPGLRSQTLMMVDKESEKVKWVDALNELHRILRRNKLPHRTVFQAKEILDSTLVIIKNALSATVIDPDRIALGTEEGLYCVDLDREGEGEIARIGDGKRIAQLEYIPDEQLLIAIAGKQRHLRLIPVGALDGHEVDWIKVADTKGCSSFCTTRMDHGGSSTYYFCVAVKKQVLVHQVNRTKSRHGGRQVISVPGVAQCLDVWQDRLCVGLPSLFYLYSLQGTTEPICLVQPDNNLSFLYHNPMDAFMAVELPNNEYLLVFSQLGVFVNNLGKKTREKEVMFSALPLAVSYHDSYLCVYMESHVDVYEVTSGDWVQTMNLKKTKPLCRQGQLCFSLTTEAPQVLYLHPVHRREHAVRVEPHRPGAPHALGPLRGSSSSVAASLVTRARRRFSVREQEKLPKGDRRSRMISAPSNFNHIQHMGPSELQKLIDLPTTAQGVAAMEEKRAWVKSVKPPGLFQASHLESRTQGVPLQPKRPAPLAPGHRTAKSSLTASPDGSLSSQEHTSGPQASSAHDDSGHQSSPRHSIASNNSSNLSSPPSPVDLGLGLEDAREQFSSSYESQS